MDEETWLLIQELVGLVQEARHEAAALRQVLVDKKLTTDKEMQLRIDDVRREEKRHLKSEAIRRAWEKKLKDLPKQ